MGQAGSKMERVERAHDAGDGQRGGRRLHVEKVLALAGHLAPKDAFLVRQVFEFGMKVRDISLQAGRGRGCIYRRPKTILRRLRSPLFAFVVSHGDLLTPSVRRTGELVICQGIPQAQVAARTCRSRHAVRQDMHTIRSLARF